MKDLDAWAVAGKRLFEALDALAKEVKSVMTAEQKVAMPAYFDAVQTLSFVKNGQIKGSVPPFASIKPPKVRKHGHH